MWSNNPIRVMFVAAVFLVVLAACSAPAATPVPAPAATVAVPPAAATILPNNPSSGDQLRFVVIPEDSQARYRVREQLANRDLPNDAVGATNIISGTMVVDANGNLVPGGSRFVIDVSTLASDSSRRDGYLGNNVLQTGQFPNVTFVPTAIQGVPSPLPASGEGTFEMTGDLTIRDVTRPTTWAITLRREGETLTGQANTSFTFADFNLPQPRVPILLSLQDLIKLELDFTMLQQ